MVPSVQKTLDLTPELLRATAEELGWLESSESLIVQRIEALADPSSLPQASQRTRALLKGSLLLYLFAIWEAHLPPDFKEWMTELELQEFEAYEHIRDSVAHAKLGQRAEFRRRRKAFEAFHPFAGVSWDSHTDAIDIADSFVVNEFFSFMMGMSAQLAGRIHGDVKPIRK
ncbi:hypothetical protein PFX98_07650 [Paucibacter sediminis]|uniref:Uncharacterized protein n=1 Tax=Paucibacter sediminis TaxID=3019553 RepID=A0AA95SMN1_9BURK|nr:hypothetical protein [Paucibacter sp. S2-9]WIT13478.1 hypothetical protein PFX98_07650 [Paucibacter sp. S2-9]